MIPARIPPRVVVDTNGVLSALVFGGGRLGTLGGAWQSGQYVPLASSKTVSELIRVLAYPKLNFRLQTGRSCLLIICLTAPP